MTYNVRDRNPARTKAQRQFVENQKRALSFREEQEKARAEMEVKNLRLRTLRLAKEAEEREEAAKLAKELAAADIEQAAAPKAKKRRARIKKS